MLLLWSATFGLSVYITINRPNIPESDIIIYLISLVSLALLSVLVSYVHLTILSPLSDVRSRIREGIEEEIEE